MQCLSAKPHQVNTSLIKVMMVIIFTSSTEECSIFTSRQTGTTKRYSLFYTPSFMNSWSRVGSKYADINSVTALKCLKSQLCFSLQWPPRKNPSPFNHPKLCRVYSQVGAYNNKGSFGELALMYNTPRYVVHHLFNWKIFRMHFICTVT